MLTLTLKLVFFVSVLRASLATPLTTDEKKSQYEKLASDVQNAVQNILTNLQPEQQNSTKSDNWLFVVVKQVNGDLLGHEIIAKIAAINDATLTAELVSLADGFHLVIASSEPEIEYNQRIVATAITEMLMSLKNMERIDTIMANCSFHSTINVLFHNNGSLILDHSKTGNQSGEYIKALFLHWIESMNAILENDAQLGKEYKVLKTNIESKMAVQGPQNLVSTAQPFQGEASAMEEKIALQITNSQLFRKVALNRLFLKQATKHAEVVKTIEDCRQFLLSRALIDLSKRSEVEGLDLMYHQVLSEIALTISSRDTMDQMKEKLFIKLREVTEQYGDALKKKVKQIEDKLDVWITFRMLKNNISLV